MHAVRARRAALALWLDYSFPGNVRELRNIVIRLTTKYAGQTSTPSSCRPSSTWRAWTSSCPEPRSRRISRRCSRRRSASSRRRRSFSLDETLQQWERGYVEAALLITQGNLTQAAKLLGIHRTTLYSRMQNYATPDERRSPCRHELRRPG